MKKFPKIAKAIECSIKNFEDSNLTLYDTYFRPSIFNANLVDNSVFFNNEIDEFNVNHKLAYKFKAEARDLIVTIFEEFSKLKSSKNSHIAKDLSIYDGEEYFTPSLYVSEIGKYEVISHTWKGYELDNDLYKAGLTFKEKQDALTASEEMIELLAKIKYS